jgi:sigma-B regulation protein RsbU (phosphoserine phosphatase)
MEWYTAPMQSGHGHWSEPYFDEGGGEMMMSTYSLPIRDASGRSVAVFTADVSLEWLSEVINAHHIYPSSYNLLLSRTGQIMVCPVESFVMRKNITQVTAGMQDSTVNYINRQMMAGKSGQATVNDNKGGKNYVFFDRIDGDTGWSMAVVCADSEIYHGLRMLALNVFILMLIGLILLGYIIWRAARSGQRLMAINAEKERMGSELHIASEIQKGMLPKIFPPYPERDDMEIFGSLVPAKEVGGDLYDFYIRDEKLFFCIGDVSGKGVPASLVMAVTRSLFRTVSVHDSSPERIITMMNNSMAEMNDTNMFVTLFLGVLDLPTGRLRYCNAGHCPPVLIGDGVGFVPIKSNLPLGTISGWSFEGQEVLILPQTTIFLYTDGLTEAENAMHGQFGEDRMLEAVKNMGCYMPQAMIEQMTSAVHAFVDDAEQSDDLTMLVIRYTKEQLDVRLARNLMLQNDVSQVPQLAQFVDEICEAVGLDAATTMKMNLAIEEAVVNVMRYAYLQDTIGDINIEAQANDVRLKFVITDTGMPFDPTAMKEVDTSLSLEERSIGGLGIHLVRQIMDSINYERINGTNVLTLRKKFNH